MECYDNLVQLEDELGAPNYKPLEVVIAREEIDCALERLDSVFSAR